VVQRRKARERGAVRRLAALMALAGALCAPAPALAQTDAPPAGSPPAEPQSDSAAAPPADAEPAPTTPPPAAATPPSPAAPPGAVAPAPPRTASGPAEYDPLEPFNRKIFWFNDKVDVYVLEPAAKGWDFVVPRRVETSISNFFFNLRFPIETLNDLLQGKFRYAASDVGRFVVNTTVGVAGFFDPATGWGMPLHWEDFGQTLGWWGAGPGAYLVLPILGPSDVRDGSGLVVDYASSVTPFFVNGYILLGARTVDVVNTRAQYLETVAKAKESAFDYYTFVRNAYLQRRRGWVNDQAPDSAESEEDLYHPEED
jgi:phospholipid-binding lipoprotein MlaA